MKTKIKDLTIFEQVFIGEFVNIISDLETTETEQDGENYSHKTSSVTFTGFLLDQDENYYYMGDSGNEITCAIEKTSVKFIQILDPNGPLDEILDTLPDAPSNKNEVN